MAVTEETRLLVEMPKAVNSKPQSRALTWIFCIATLLISCIGGAVFVVLESRVASTRKAPLHAKTQIERLDAYTFGAGSVVSPGCKSKVLLMRHCEKSGNGTKDSQGNQHCSPIGYRRADYVANLFGEDARWKFPNYMYAMSRSRPGVHHLNYREIETLSPLEEKAGVGIDTRFSEGTERALADDLFAKMSTGKVCDSLTVVNWKHSRMSVMGKALGCGPEEGCPKNYEKDEFDIIWQIEYAYESKIDVGSLGGSEDRDDGTWVVSGSVVNEQFNPY
jgi:hypothetical protein